jgi:hypothetical protein
VPSHLLLLQLMLLQAVSPHLLLLLSRQLLLLLPLLRLIVCNLLS